MFSFWKHITQYSFAGRVLILCLQVGAFHTGLAQETQKINPEFANGNFIDEVRIIVVENNLETVVDETEMENFYKAFFIKPGSTFNPLLTDLALNRIKEEEFVTDAKYELFESATGTGTLGRSVLLKIYVTLSQLKEESSVEKGFLTKDGAKDFPVIYESGKAQFKLFLNGGLGLYNDVNPLFAQGEKFTQGNPIADAPPGKETRFWAEAFLEPGISGISKLGKSNIYAYDEISALVSARNTTDIYSSGSAAFIAFERLYGGFLATGIGKNKDITINANYGRNFFQLNDGFYSPAIPAPRTPGRVEVFIFLRELLFKKMPISRFSGKNCACPAILLSHRNCLKTVNRISIMPSVLLTLTIIKIWTPVFPTSKPVVERENMLFRRVLLKKKECTLSIQNYG